MRQGKKAYFIKKKNSITTLTCLYLFFQNVHVHIVDMSSPRGLWEFASSFTQDHSVHVLVSVFRVLVRACVRAAKIMPCIITDVIHPGILNQIKSN